MSPKRTKLASELRQNRAGWLLCEFLGDELAERVHNQVIDTSNLSYLFDELLSTGVLRKEMTREEVMGAFEEKGLLDDIRRKSRTELERAQGVQGAFPQAKNKCDKWLREVNLLMFAEPLFQRYWHLGEYVEEDQWKWSIGLEWDLYPHFFRFLCLKGTKEADDLLDILLRRHRNRLWYFEERVKALTKSKETWQCFRELTDRAPQILRKPIEERAAALKEVEKELSQKDILPSVPSRWNRNFEWNRDTFSAFMQRKGWHRRDVIADQLGTSKRIVGEILSGGPIPEDVIQTLDELAAQIRWDPEAGLIETPDSGNGSAAKSSYETVEWERDWVWNPPNVYALVKDCQSRWGCNQKTVAERLGISQPHLSNLMRGRQQASDEIALKLDRLVEEIGWRPQNRKQKEVESRSNLPH